MENPTSVPPVSTPTPPARQDAVHLDSRLFIPFGIIGLFIVVLVASFFFVDHDKKSEAEPAKGMSTAAPEIIDLPPQPTPVAPAKQIPPPPQQSSMGSPSPVIAPRALSVPYGVPLIPGTLAYDFNGDGVLNNADMKMMTDKVEQFQYSALFDLNSDSMLNHDDFAILRGVLAEYPEICYDMNMDHRLDGADVAMVAAQIDNFAFSAYFDFNADSMVNTQDLAIIRDAVAEAGTSGTTSTQ